MNGFDLRRRREIRFGELILPAERPYLIAEAGVNHETDIGVALSMVEQAAQAGADAIKFQSYKAATLASRYSPSYWDLSKEPTTSQHELFQKYDAFDVAEYRMLAAHAAKCGITFLSTPFDERFVDELGPLMPVFKIASADLTNAPLLKRVAAKGKPVILSTGAATPDEIRQAVAWVREVNDSPLALLHCVLSYPTAPADANLAAIAKLGDDYPDLVIGYSDHVPPHHDCLTLTLAWLCGARIIEKHFTLDKTKSGNDHYHAMDPADIAAFREQCAFASALVGSPREAPFACETQSRLQARRSLVVTRDLPAGHEIASADLAVKRPGTGIPPDAYEAVIGRRLRRALREDEILTWDALLS